MNKRLRLFQDELTDVINRHSELPWEARLLALELITTNVQRMADNAILAEISEEEKNAESIPEN